MLAIALAVIVAIQAPTPPPSTATDAALDQAFTHLLQADADAEARGDDRAYEQRKTPGFFAVDERGVVRTMNAEAAAFGATPEARERTRREYAEVQLKERVTDVHATVYGNVAIVRSRLVMSLVLNSEPVAKQFRLTHVFVRQGDEWRLASKHETVIPLDPIPVAVNRRVYDDYVGHYRLTSFRTYTVTRDGDRLLWGNTVKHELVPESESTFVISGDQYRVTFVRDSKGVVTHLRLREFPGVEYSATRTAEAK